MTAKVVVEEAATPHTHTLTFSIFLLEGDFYRRAYRNARRVFLDHFLRSLGIIFGAVMMKKSVRKKALVPGNLVNY